MPDVDPAGPEAAERLLARGDTAAALRAADAAFSAGATSPAWHRLRGLALAAEGRVTEACPHLRHYAELEPADADAWVNLGNACLETNEVAYAVSAFARAGQAGASGAAYLLGRGLALLAAGSFGEASDLLRRARALEPDAPDVRLAFAQCLAEFERFDGIGDELAGIDPRRLGFAQRTTYAWLSAVAGRDEAALALYRQIIHEQPAAAAPRIQAALLLERLNRVDEAAALLDAGDQDEIGHGSMAVLARSRIARRHGGPARVADTVAEAASRESDPAMAGQLWFELARWQDQLDEPDAAMAALALAHDRAGVALLQRHPGRTPGDVLGWLGERLRGPLPQPRPRRADVTPDPVFLVGFPRSGTTLLEQMLDRHPALQVLDERPALERTIDALHALPGWPAGNLDLGLARLDDGQCDQLRARYRDEVARHVRGTGRLVDKYPLYLTRVAHIQRLFPAADWLLLLRHPCDCVLSCHFQAFGLNGGALAFASLESTARTYAAVMGYWEEQRVLAKPRVHVLRYEDLVADPGATLARLMASIRLEVSSDQLAFPAAVAARVRRINTPSYAQVAEAVHARAVGRWRRYRAHFSAATLAHLAPFVERYGYSLD